MALCEKLQSLRDDAPRCPPRAFNAIATSPAPQWQVPSGKAPGECYKGKVPAGMAVTANEKELRRSIA